MKKPTSPQSVFTHDQVTSFYNTIAEVASFRDGRPVGGVSVKDAEMARAAIRKTAAAILGFSGGDAYVADVRASDIGDIKSISMNASPNFIVARLRGVFFATAEEVTPLFFHEVNRVSSWNVLIRKIQKKFITLIDQIPAQKMNSIARRCKAFGLEKFDVDGGAPHPLDLLDSEVVMIGTLILTHGVMSITSNLNTFIAAAEVSLPVGFWHDEVKIKPRSGFPENQWDGTGTRLLKLAPGPMVIITGSHFQKLKSMLPPVDFSTNFKVADFVRDLDLDSIFAFLGEYYRGQASKLSDRQFNDWCLYAINCATERFIFSV